MNLRIAKKFFLTLLDIRNPNQGENGKVRQAKAGTTLNCGKLRCNAFHNLSGRQTTKRKGRNRPLNR